MDRQERDRMQNAIALIYGRYNDALADNFQAGQIIQQLTIRVERLEQNRRSMVRNAMMPPPRRIGIARDAETDMRLLDFLMIITHNIYNWNDATVQQMNDIMATTSYLGAWDGVTGRTINRFTVCNRTANTYQLNWTGVANNIRLVDFYKQKYDYTVRYPDAPLVITDRRLLLPLEVVYLHITMEYNVQH